MRLLKHILIAGTFFLFSPLGIVAQAATPEATPEAAADEQANQIFQQTCDFLRGQQSFSFDLDITYDNVLDSGQKVQYSAFQMVKAKKPNQLRVDYEGDQRNTDFYYNGKIFTWLNTDKNLYSTQPAPATIDETVALLEAQYGITLPLSNLVVSDPCKTAQENIKRVEYVGLGLVNRKPAHHLFINGQDRDWQMWVSTGNQAMPLKIVITYKDLPGLPQYTGVISNWNSNPSLSPNSFLFSVPDQGATKIDFLKTENTIDLLKK
jgi:hypothetical protein